jgi:hypothetical protein
MALIVALTGESKQDMDISVEVQPQRSNLSATNLQLWYSMRMESGEDIHAGSDNKTSLEFGGKPETVSALRWRG